MLILAAAPQALGFSDAGIIAALGYGVVFLGLVLLSWFYLIMIIAIKLDSPGPVFFTQKRVGKGKTHFQIHKFRTMRIDTPHDMPTHMLSNPEQYITRTGKFMRKYSIDELPQIWDIFVGNMSIIGVGCIIETTKKSIDFSRVVAV